MSCGGRQRGVGIGGSRSTPRGHRRYAAAPPTPTTSPMTSPSNLCLQADPDISGIGVRAAIYMQNLLSVISAIWALWDGKVTKAELDSVET
ncbi:hypothetical protein B0H13DRAFT_2336373 [Mycena leptocephala]|nr:hypothetical protein B0H13DRAFT_2336373 [Mycena leptocephala]